MDNNQISVEDADKLLMEAFGKTAPAEPVVEDEPTPEPAAAPTTPEPTPPEAPAAPEAPEAPTAPATPTVDWLPEVPETVRDKVQETINKLQNAEQRLRSDDGRVRAYQKQADELKAKLLEIQKPQSTSAAPSVPSTPEEWQRVIDHDPVLAKAIEDRLESKLQEFKKANIEPITQRQLTQDEIRQSDEVARERELLVETIPEAFEIVKTDMFKGWLEHEAPPAVRQAMLSSNDHRDHVAGLNLFAMTMINSGRVAPPEASPSGAVASPPAQVIDPARAATIAASRDRRSEASPIHGRTPPPAVGLPDPNKPLTLEEAEAILLESYTKRTK